MTKFAIVIELSTLILTKNLDGIRKLLHRRLPSLEVCRLERRKLKLIQESMNFKLACLRGISPVKRWDLKN